MTNDRESLTAEEFVRLWQSCKSVTEVTEKAGRTYTAVVSRANTLRKKGVNLKKMPHTGRPKQKVEVDKLNAIIESLTNGETS